MAPNDPPVDTPVPDLPPQANDAAAKHREIRERVIQKTAQYRKQLAKRQVPSMRVKRGGRP